MLEIIGAAFKILQMLLGEWFKYTSEKKETVKEILKEIPNAQTPSDISKLFDRIHRT